MSGNIGPLLVAAGHSTTPHGTFNPAASLAPQTASAAEQATAYDARYGAGAYEAHKTTAGETAVDLTPLYIAHGWPLPILEEDFNDEEEVSGAVAWVEQSIAALQASPPASALGGVIMHVASLATQVAQLQEEVEKL